MKICFCGDFVCQDVSSIKVDEELLKLFKSVDYVSLNFEVPVRGCGTPIYKGGPSLTQDSNAPSFLENFGINIVQLANKHRSSILSVRAKKQKEYLWQRK